MPTLVAFLGHCNVFDRFVLCLDIDWRANFRKIQRFLSDFAKGRAKEVLLFLGHSIFICDAAKSCSVNFKTFALSIAIKIQETSTKK